MVNGTTYSYDSLNRLTNLNHSNGTNNVAFYNYVYDVASRITKITDVDGATDYTYDNRAQLTGANHSNANNPDETYTYDANGNRVTSSIHGNGYVTGKGNRLLSDGKYNYEYDNEGNLTKQTEIATGKVQELTWDYRNRLVAFVDKDAAGKETQRVEFTYDAFNRRIAKAIDTNPQDTTPAVVTQFVYDGSNVLLEFVDSDGAGANQPVLDKRYLHGAGVDQVLAQEIAGNVVWLLTDHLGTVRDLVNNSGAVVNHLVYDSYGQVISESNPAVDTRYLFTGREFDSETGLYYYRARYYDQTMGRFLSEDPIGFDGKDNNLYRYVFNSPLMFNDPSGNIIPLICVALGITELDLLFLAGLTAIGINTVNNQQQNSQNNSPLENRSSSGDDDSIKGGHDKNKRPSSQEKHEKGDERRGRDQGGEKGDARRRPNPNKRR
ncbi:RHS repeat-associated core domain-containing protein [Aphanizomenon flos-aquae]|uniref:RHS repeat-associated core domain-containing protein n=1 Tax=Aphanizomenon flos-aquae TaxID=1176 RepID=UPI0018EF444C|nr:RHS repeat-associated core domain-containing protein [Aphanizomenon flos-aquae]